MAVIKKVGIKESGSSSVTNVKNIGAEAQNVNISYNSGGQVIEDITQPGVVVSSTKSAAKAIKDINDGIDSKASQEAVNKKVPLVNGKVPSQYLPSYADDIIEGYYNAEDSKFYKENTYTTEIQGEEGKIYVDLNENSMYRWESGSGFIEILNATNKALSSLTDVNTSNPQDGEALTYDAATGKWVNKNVTSHIVHIPTVVVGTYTYNGQPQGPTISNLDSDFYDYVTVTGATATDAGNYTLTFSLKNTFTTCWSDLTTTNKTESWSIGKAAGSLTLAANSVTLDDDHKTVSVGFSRLGTGAVSASSNDTGIATVAVSGNNIVITATEEDGSATITVNVAADNNYTAASDSIAVTADFLVIKSFNLATDTELKDMLDAYYADKVSLAKLGWHVGDTRVMHFNEMNAPSPQAAGSKWAAQDIVIVIVAMEHTDLVTPINGHTKACITVQTREVMNNNTSSKGTNGHIYVNGNNSKDMTFTKWSNLYMRTYLNNTVLGAIPEGDFKSSIKQSKHYRHTNYNTADDELVTDTLFLPSCPEVFDIASSTWLSYVPTTHTEGTQFEWYQTEANRVKQGNNNGNKNGTNQDWWEGSTSNTYSSSRGYYWLVTASGNYPSIDDGMDAAGLAPAFAM